MRRSYAGLFNQTEVNTWCDNAANLWPGGDREALRAKCKKASILDPWTMVGKLAAGLPANFSTNPEMVQGGAGAAVIGAGQEVIAIVNPTAKDQPPGGGAYIGPSGVTAVRQEPTTVPGLFDPGQWMPQSAASNLPLILGVGAVGVAALLYFTRSKRGGSLSGYSRKRRSRRSRRSRR